MDPEAWQAHGRSGSGGLVCDDGGGLVKKKNGARRVNNRRMESRQHGSVSHVLSECRGLIDR
jgi:hypothetical protein